MANQHSAREDKEDKVAASAAAAPEADAPASAAPAKAVVRVDLNDPELHLNRELSLLAFQRRVLEEATDESNPLLERLKFLAILGSNLDEFFMVRVAALEAQLDAGSLEAGPDVMSPRAQLVAIRREVKRLMKEAHDSLEQMMPALKERGIFIYDYSELSDAHRRVAKKYFDETIFPGADAAGVRSGPSISAHLQSEPEPGGADSRSPGRTSTSPA